MSEESFKGEVYLLTNLVNLKYYVGATCRGLQYRLEEHCEESVGGSRRTIMNAIRKYGKENFIIELLSTASNLQDLNNLERIWINLLQAMDNGYNMHTGGRLGGRFSEQARKNLSLSHQGKTLSSQHKEKIRIGMLGKVFSDKHRANIVASAKVRDNAPHRGLVRSEDARKRISEGLKLRYKEHGSAVTGRKHTEEELTKMSETMKASHLRRRLIKGNQ